MTGNDEARPAAWLIEWQFGGGKFRSAFTHNAIGDYRDMVDPDATSEALYTATDYEALRAEVARLRQAYWDARAAMGFDNDGDPTPAAIVPGTFRALMLSDAKEIRADLKEARREAEAAEAKVARMAELKHEYRPTMDRDVLHSWVTDMLAALNDQGQDSSEAPK